ncbi:hypothetical protein [Roseovarius sp. BRH_c41]|jgi:hypothetical protein|uniref:hypothetical protein n=1 Tax=Roseovarius sp. BRH_c41 TaxID=1629709 RepID=UPI0005F1CF88|nr:hypothetical protein [Roseovarius sp. BRH_c41]KJS44881.1 MAG: hypothetical protein VR71_04135 [Roseovarius sp. BRH_c41]
MIRFLALFGLALMAACTNANDLDEAPAYLGNFHLGHNVVVAPNLTKGPASREASKEEWIAAMTLAMTDRFGRYEGTKLYHLGVSVEGYVLAIPGVPLVASPKSALILNVTAWDDAKGAKLNAKPHLVTVVESFSGNTFLGSGLTQSKEKQLENLSRNAAKQIQNWLVQQNNEFGWFEDDGVPANDKPRPEARLAEVPTPLAASAPVPNQAAVPSAAELASAAAEVNEEPAVASPPAE